MCAYRPPVVYDYGNEPEPLLSGGKRGLLDRDDQTDNKDSYHWPPRSREYEESQQEEYDRPPGLPREPRPDYRRLDADSEEYERRRPPPDERDRDRYGRPLQEEEYRREARDPMYDDRAPRRHPPDDLDPRRRPPDDLDPRRRPPDDLDPRRRPPDDLDPRRHPPDDIDPRYRHEHREGERSYPPDFRDRRAIPPKSKGYLLEDPTDRPDSEERDYEQSHPSQRSPKPLLGTEGTYEERLYGRAGPRPLLDAGDGDYERSAYSRPVLKPSLEDRDYEEDRRYPPPGPKPLLDTEDRIYEQRGYSRPGFKPRLDVEGKDYEDDRPYPRPGPRPLLDTEDRGYEQRGYSRPGVKPELDLEGGDYEKDRRYPPPGPKPLLATADADYEQSGYPKPRSNSRLDLKGSDYRENQYYSQPSPKPLLDAGNRDYSRSDPKPLLDKGSRDYEPSPYSRPGPKPLLDTADSNYEQSINPSAEPKPLLDTRGDGLLPYPSAEPKPLPVTRGDGLLSYQGADHKHLSVTRGYGLLPTPASRESNKPVSLLDLPEINPMDNRVNERQGRAATGHQPNKYEFYLDRLDKSIKRLGKGIQEYHRDAVQGPPPKKRAIDNTPVQPLLDENTERLLLSNMIKQQSQLQQQVASVQKLHFTPPVNVPNPESVASIIEKVATAAKKASSSTAVSLSHDQFATSVVKSITNAPWNQTSAGVEMPPTGYSANTFSSSVGAFGTAPAPVLPPVPAPVQTPIPPLLSTSVSSLMQASSLQQYSQAPTPLLGQSVQQYSQAPSPLLGQSVQQSLAVPSHASSLQQYSQAPTPLLGQSAQQYSQAPSPLLGQSVQQSPAVSSHASSLQQYSQAPTPLLGQSVQQYSQASSPLLGQSVQQSLAVSSHASSLQQYSQAPTPLLGQSVQQYSQASSPLLGQSVQQSLAVSSQYSSISSMPAAIPTPVSSHYSSISSMPAAIPTPVPAPVQAPVLPLLSTSVPSLMQASVLPQASQAPTPLLLGQSSLAASSHYSMNSIPTPVAAPSTGAQEPQSLLSLPIPQPVPPPVPQPVPPPVPPPVQPPLPPPTIASITPLIPRATVTMATPVAPPVIVPSALTSKATSAPAKFTISYPTAYSRIPSEKDALSGFQVTPREAAAAAATTTAATTTAATQAGTSGTEKRKRRFMQDWSEKYMQNISFKDSKKDSKKESKPKPPSLLGPPISLFDIKVDDTSIPQHIQRKLGVPRTGRGIDKVIEQRTKKIVQLFYPKEVREIVEEQSAVKEEEKAPVVIFNTSSRDKPTTELKPYIPKQHQRIIEAAPKMLSLPSNPSSNLQPYIPKRFRETSEESKPTSSGDGLLGQQPTDERASLQPLMPETSGIRPLLDQADRAPTMDPGTNDAPLYIDDQKTFILQVGVLDPMYQQPMMIKHRYNKPPPSQYGLPHKRKHDLPKHSGPVTHLRWCTPMFSHLLMSVSMDNTLKIWDVFKEKPTSKLVNFHEGAIKDAVWGFDGRQVVSCGFDKTARVVDIPTCKELRIYDHPTFVTCVKFHPEQPQIFITGTYNSGIVCWDTRTHTVVRKYEGNLLGQVLDVQFLPGGNEFLSSCDVVSQDSASKTIIAWDFGSSAVVSNQIYQELYTCPTLKLHPGMKEFVAQSNGDYIVKFDATRPFTMNKRVRFEGHKVKGYPIGCNFSPNGEFLLSGSADGKMYTYNYAYHINKKPFVHKLNCYETALIDVAPHPFLNGVCATCSWGGDITVWK